MFMTKNNIFDLDSDLGYFKDKIINPYSEIKLENKYELKTESTKPKVSVAEMLGNMVIDEATKAAEKLFDEKGAKLSPESKKWLRDTTESLYRRILEEQA